ncbi:MAG: SpaA isopeptide-forming pilin-related protein [Chloroflexota bacterium]
MFHHTKAQRSLTASRSLVFVSLMALAVALLVGIRPALATQPDSSGEHKVTICHRTNSITNPYTVNTVDYSSVDGGLVHDNGNGDHTEHLGPVFDWENPPPAPHNGDQWGDIIPPFSWEGDAQHVGGSFPGLNWTDEGQAIYNDGKCDGADTAPTPTPVPTGTPGATGTPNATPTPTPEGDEDASLKIRKISTERTATNRVIRLEGAVFTVEGQPGTFTTDEHGEFCITGLPEDVVLRVTEIVPPAGYELANPAWQDVEVDNDGDCDSAEAVFENPPEVVATPTPTPEGSEAGSTGTPAPTATPKVTSTPEGSVAAATGTPRPLPNTATDAGSQSALIVLGFGMLLLGSIGTLGYASVAARRRND